MHPKKPVMRKKGRLENQGADKMLKTIPGKDSLIYHGKKSGYVLREVNDLCLHTSWTTLRIAYTLLITL